MGIHPIRSLRSKLTDRSARRRSRVCVPAVLYDFDGTIADTLDVSTRIYNDMARRRGYREVTTDNLQSLRGMTLREAADTMGVSMAMIPVLLARGRRRMLRHIADVPGCIGVERVVRKVHEHGVTQMIVTSNASRNVRTYLEAHSLALFGTIAGGVGFAGKTPRIKRLIKKYHLDTARTLYVGDEVRDIEAAHRAGIAIVAVTWGANTRAALEAAHPDYVVDSPQELLDIIRERVG